MLPVTKPNEIPASSAHKSKVINKTLNETRSQIQEKENDAGSIPTVCRVCLTMKVKMYQISEHKLKDMYERVTGIEINTKDELQELCWECVARLSSANQFIEKALKTHWILMKINKRGRRITIKDIKTIDTAQNKLESTLAAKHYKVNHSDFHIIEETAEIGNIYEFNNEIIGETFKNNCYDEENDFDCTDDEEEQIYVISADTSDEKDPIKSEQVDTDKEENTIDIVTSYETDINNVKYENDDAGISNEEPIKEENICNDKLADRNVDESHEVCEVTEQRRKKRNNSPAPLRNRNMLPRCKELLVVLEDIMLSKCNTQDSYERPTANAASVKENKNYISETFNNTEIKEAVENKITRTLYFSVKDHGNTSQSISTRISNVNMNRSLMIINTENLNKLFICNICKKRFHHKSTLIQHIMEHPKMYNCTYCNYETYHKGNLGRHVNSKHTKKTVFNCSYCSFEAYGKSDVNQHINSKHTKKTVFNCSYCNYKTCTKARLYRHINSRHTKNTVFNCSFCSYKAYQKIQLRQHINCKHTKSTVFNCSYCNYKTYVKSDLGRHTNSKHTKSTVFNCSYCSYKAYQKCHLNLHINSQHTKRTVFNCAYCSYKAYRKCHLKLHINSQHTKRTVFNCAYCSYKTYRKCHLNLHINTQHTKRTVFNCAYCSYKVYRKSSLCQHIKSQHTKSF